MKTPCIIVAEILQLLAEKVVPGITTIELDTFAVNEAKKRKSKPAFKGYCKYPSSLCCSPNNKVVHGIPNSHPLKDGDILSLDFGVLYDDFFGDAAITLPVGTISDHAKKLLTVTEQSLYKGIDKAVPGARLHDISSSIQTFVENNGFSVVKDFVGHGIGRNLHEEPQIPNYGKAGTGVKLKSGMVLAIEPMINQGAYNVNVLEDGWTVVTSDGSLSAHFEHTVAITNAGPVILTHIN